MVNIISVKRVQSMQKHHHQKSSGQADRKSFKACQLLVPAFKRTFVPSLLSLTQGPEFRCCIQGRNASRVGRRKIQHPAAGTKRRNSKKRNIAKRYWLDVQVLKYLTNESRCRYFGWRICRCVATYHAYPLPPRSQHHRRSSCHSHHCKYSFLWYFCCGRFERCSEKRR